MMVGCTRFPWICLVAVAIALQGCGQEGKSPIPANLEGSPELGKQLVHSYGCGSCHIIPGIASADGIVGPPLTAMARRAYVGGILPNTPSGMIRWLRNPPGVDPQTAMPNLGVTERQAANIASYLYTLK